MYTGYNIPEPYTIGALHWITYIDVCIYLCVRYAAKFTVCFSATEVCVRVDHDKRVQDARLGVFEPRPSGSQLREHYVGKLDLHGRRCGSWTDNGQRL